MSDDLDKQRAINWIRQQLAFERMLEVYRMKAYEAPEPQATDGRAA